jgi:hypothetical protein
MQIIIALSLSGLIGACPASADLTGQAQFTEYSVNEIMYTRRDKSKLSSGAPFISHRQMSPTRARMQSNDGSDDIWSYYLACLWFGKWRKWYEIFIDIRAVHDSL